MEMIIKTNSMAEITDGADLIFFFFLFFNVAALQIR